MPLHASRNRSDDLPGVVPVQLDVLDDASVAAAARLCNDVTLVINNAGIAKVRLPCSATAAKLRCGHHLETNFYGVLRVSREFAPVLKGNSGGALLERVVRCGELHQRAAARHLFLVQDRSLGPDECAAE